MIFNAFVLGDTSCGSDFLINYTFSYIHQS